MQLTFSTAHPLIAFILTVSIGPISNGGGLVVAINCFKCASVGGSFPQCEDPFHNNGSEKILEENCMGGLKGRDGLFPATACLKLAGTFSDSKEYMVVRGCGRDSGTLTVDTEIVRMSHCGSFLFDDRYVRGCVQSCFDDGCNGDNSIRPHTLTVILLSAVSAVITS